MKKIISLLIFAALFIVAFGQGTDEPIAWKDMITEIITILLAVIAFIGRFFIKGSKADILEWIKKFLNFILDFLPAKQSDGKFNGVGEPYKE